MALGVLYSHCFSPSELPEDHRSICLPARGSLSSMPSPDRALEDKFRSASASTEQVVQDLLERLRELRSENDGLRIAGSAQVLEQTRAVDAAVRQATEDQSKRLIETKAKLKLADRKAVDLDAANLDLTSEAGELRGKITALEGHSKSSFDKARRAEENVKRLELQLKTLHDEAQAKASALEHGHADVVEQNRFLAQQVEQRDKSIRGLEDKCATLTRRLQELQQRPAESIPNFIDKLKDQLDTYKLTSSSGVESGVIFSSPAPEPPSAGAGPSPRSTEQRWSDDRHAANRNAARNRRHSQSQDRCTEDASRKTPANFGASAGSTHAGEDTTSAHEGTHSGAAYHDGDTRQHHHHHHHHQQRGQSNRAIARGRGRGRGRGGRGNHSSRGRPPIQQIDAPKPAATPQHQGETAQIY